MSVMLDPCIVCVALLVYLSFHRFGYVFVCRKLSPHLRV